MNSQSSVLTRASYQNGSLMTPTSSHRGRNRDSIFIPLPVTHQGHDDQHANSTFALYLGFENARPEGRFFRSKTVRVSNSSQAKQHINFASVFAQDFINHHIYTTLVVVDDRRYIVAGSYEDGLSDNNMAIGAFCNSEYKGDLAVFFLPKYNKHRFLGGMPCYPTTERKQEVLQRVITAFAENVISHVENGAPLKRLLRG